MLWRPMLTILLLLLMWRLIFGVLILMLLLEPHLLSREVGGEGEAVGVGAIAAEEVAEDEGGVVVEEGGVNRVGIVDCCNFAFC